ncbi:MAG: twin-arginine translocase subunit TatC [Zetaproteobacteria bacterium]|nr:twin-arginine translocase subunit TatC [Zetaproteobacteria bacterium]
MTSPAENTSTYHSSPDETEEQLIGGGKVMSLTDHLAELRTRIVRSGIAILGMFFACLIFSSQILIFLRAPLDHVLAGATSSLHFTGPLDVFLVNIKVSMLSGIVLSSPVWLWQFWSFFEPALYPRERKLILPFALTSLLLFLAGVCFCYFAILPLALDFLIELGKEVSTPMITITDYISVLSMMIFGFGLVFEAPLVLIMLGLLGLVDPNSLAKSRRFVIIGILFIAAIMTPPDPLSQLGMAIPMYMMFEISIVIMRIMLRNSKASAS